MLGRHDTFLNRAVFILLWATREKRCEHKPLEKLKRCWWRMEKIMTDTVETVCSVEPPRLCGCYAQMDPGSSVSVSSVFLLLAFLQEVSLYPTDGIWSELHVCYVTESFPGLTCVCHHSARKSSSSVEAAAIAQSSFWTCSCWRRDLSPIGVLSCVTVISTSCFSVRLGESPKVVIWVFGGVYSKCLEKYGGAWDYLVCVKLWCNVLLLWFARYRLETLTQNKHVSLFWNLVTGQNFLILV